MRPQVLIKWYYAGTAVFLLLDLILGFNLRLAFLDASLTARLLYYGFCFVCLALMVWRPAWTGVVGAVESLITLVALLLIVAPRVMMPTATLESGGAPLSLRELMNFLMAGGAAYFSYVSAMNQLRRPTSSLGRHDQ